MCGIAGIVRYAEGAPAIARRELDAMSAALARRGPDGEGSWFAPGGDAALAHRRLAILDLSAAAAQPMASRDGRYRIVYNGEIYDHRRHRAALEREGVELRTQSDTEMLLELVTRHGAEALCGLRGMYAFAIWDDVERRLLLARDPYGIKPLYYAAGGGVVRFASQVRALEAGGISREVDRAAVAGFLCWGAVPEPRTLRREIRAVPAGHLLRVSFADGVRTEGLAYRSPTVETPTIEEALAGSVRDHLVSDVPVAVFLSAGLDSNLVAALACRAAPEPPTALTLTFAEASGTAADEEPLARAAAATLGMRHVVRRVDATSTRAALAEIVAAMDQPSIDGFNTFLVARLAREEGFKVALSGLGGDELFGGYPSFSDVGRWHRRSRTLARFPGIGRLWPRLAARVSSRPKLRGLVSYGGSLAGAYFLRRGLFLPEEIQTHDYDPVLDAWEGLSSELLGPVEGLLADSWRAVHRLESSLYLKNQLLRDADWAGMAHGVEIRVPWVDARLRAEVERLRFEPVRSSGKAALVRRLAPELPAALFSRPKSGFQLPIASWLGLTRPGETVPVGEQSRRLARHVLELHLGSELAAAGIAA